MKRVGVITIGQAPRHDVTPILDKYIGHLAEVIQVGVLDGMNKSEIEQNLFPVEGDYILTSRLVNGDSVVMSRDKITGILQQKIDLLEEKQCRIILILCTGVFYGLKTKQAFLLEPDHILPPLMATLLKGRKLGVLGPLQKSEAILKEKWEEYGILPLCATASPYQFERENFVKAAHDLRDQGAEVILLDCMGYVEEMKEIVSEVSGLPVMLSNALIIKVISEML